MCFLENNGMPGLTTSNSWNRARLSTEIVAFIFYFNFFSGYSKVLRLRLDQGEPL